METKTLLVLDLDETLVHATEPPLEHEPRYEVSPYFLYLRPGLGPKDDEPVHLARYLTPLAELPNVRRVEKRQRRRRLLARRCASSKNQG